MCILHSRCCTNFSSQLLAFESVKKVIQQVTGWHPACCVWKSRLRFHDVRQEWDERRFHLSPILSQTCRHQILWRDCHFLQITLSGECSVGDVLKNARSHCLIALEHHYLGPRDTTGCSSSLDQVLRWFGTTTWHQIKVMAQVCIISVYHENFVKTNWLWICCLRAGGGNLKLASLI